MPSLPPTSCPAPWLYDTRPSLQPTGSPAPWLCNTRPSLQPTSSPAPWLYNTRPSLQPTGSITPLPNNTRPSLQLYDSRSAAVHILAQKQTLSSWQDFDTHRAAQPTQSVIELFQNEFTTTSHVLCRTAQLLQKHVTPMLAYAVV